MFSFLLMILQPGHGDRISSPGASHVVAGEDQDTLVNYCLLMQMGYTYGQLFVLRKTNLTDQEVSQFNERWKDVFNTELYRTGIQATEFIRGSRFSEGNEQSFPPSAGYPAGSPDTYMIFHLAKEIAMIRSETFARCPSCREMSISKVAAYIKVTPLESLLSGKWPRLRTIPRILTQAETDTLWNSLQCLFPDRLIDPKAENFALAAPVMECTDTVWVKSVADIRVDATITWPGCTSAGTVDTIGPALVSGRPKKRNSVYEVKLIATSQCGTQDSCMQRFVIR